MKLFFIVLILLFCSCTYNFSDREELILKNKCSKLCTKLDSPSYGIGAATNGFGIPFHFFCICYNKGFIEHGLNIEIPIDTVRGEYKAEKE